MLQLPTNPILPFNRATQQQGQLMQQLAMLLGGLGGAPASMPIAPAAAMGNPEPQYNQLQTILGGLSAGLPR